MSVYAEKNSIHIIHIIYMFKLKPSPEYIAFRIKIVTCWSKTFIYVFANVCVYIYISYLHRVPLTKGVHSADDVRGELVAIFAAMAADVTLEGVSVAMATHVDGVHDVI